MFTEIVVLIHCIAI